METRINLLTTLATKECLATKFKLKEEDLVQETVLAALKVLAKGTEIHNIEAFLRTILNRKFYDMLRSKYHLPIVTISDEYEVTDEADFVKELVDAQEAENHPRDLGYPCPETLVVFD